MTLGLNMLLLQGEHIESACFFCSQLGVTSARFIKVMLCRFAFLSSDSNGPKLESHRWRSKNPILNAHETPSQEKVTEELKGYL